MSKLQIGDIVEVIIHDHAEDGDAEPMQFALYGRVSQLGRHAFELTAWGYADGSRQEDYNEKRFTVVRKAVVKITKLVPSKKQ